MIATAVPDPPASHAMALLDAAAAHATTPPRTGMQQIELHPQWPLLSRLPLQLSSGVPLPRFRVRDLLQLHMGQVIATAWPVAEDVPLRLGRVRLGMSSFEVVEQNLAVRLTRLS